MAPGLEKQRPIYLLAGTVTILTVALWYVLGPGMNSSPSGPAVARVYFADRISEAHRRVIEQFNQLHHGKIEVVPVDLPFEKFSTNERKELLARSLRSKSEKLDLFAVDLIWVPRFARWCQPLDAYVLPAERDRIMPFALRSCFHDSSLVSLPLYIDIGLMYYREDIIDRLSDASTVKRQLAGSVSWPELLRLQKRLGYEGRPFYVFQAEDYEGLVCNYLEVAMSNDPGFLSGRRMDLNSPAAKSALELLVDLVHRDHASPEAVTGFNENMSYEYMINHDAVFVRGWPNFVESMKKTLPDTLKLSRIRIAALPHVEGGHPTSVFGGWNLMLSKYASHPQEALEFVRFLQTKESQRILYETEGFLPITREIYEDTAYMRQHPDLAYSYVLLERGFHRPDMVDYTRISDILAHYVHLAVRQDLSVDEALAQASAMIKSDKVLIK